MNIFKSFLNDSDKTVNPVYVLMALLVLSSIGWVTFLVIKNHALPELSGIATLLGGGGIANIAHKAEDIVAELKKSAKQ